MAFNEKSLRSDERAVFELRSLYAMHGYERFKMSRFEEYELYVRNKDFLVSDRMITFTDNHGRMLALKPDVTISIIKSYAEQPLGVKKLYYNENVYRAQKGDSSFREIMQTGLECIGELDDYNICEVITLAVKSLELISSEYVLDISHMGFVSGLMDIAGISRSHRAEIVKLIGEKNSFALSAICHELGVEECYAKAFLQLVTNYGDMGTMIESLSTICFNSTMEEALNQLKTISVCLKSCNLESRVNVDFSVVNDMAYYNGIVFQGFVKGIPTGVLSGGQYDTLVQKVGKSKGAIGFAVYLDELEALDCESRQYDADVLVVYDDTVACDEILATVQKYNAEGLTVLPVREDDGTKKYRKKVVCGKTEAQQ